MTGAYASSSMGNARDADRADRGERRRQARAAHRHAADAGRNPDSPP